MTTTPKILIIDDDVQLCAMLSELLHLEKFEVAVEHDGPSGLARLERELFDLVILDVMMPGPDGMQTLAEIRQRSSVAVIMLTARGEDNDRIEGLERGADDYLAKPFNPRELILRLRAFLKRYAAGEPDDEQLKFHELSLQPHELVANLGETALSLTGAEFRTLEALMRAPGKVISRDELTQFALGRKLTPYDRALDTHISNLRIKLGGKQAPLTIKNVRGAGYILVSQ